jgi:hypothetical protein
MWNLLDRFRTFPKWTSYSTAEDEFGQFSLSYHEHLHRAFSQDFTVAVGSAGASLSNSYLEIQQDIGRLTACHDECRQQVLQVQTHYAEAQSLHAQLLAKQKELEASEAKEREAVSLLSKAEKALIEIRKTSQNVNDLRKAQHDFDVAVSHEHDSKRDYDRVKSDFRQFRQHYERQFVGLVIVSIEAASVLKGETVKKIEGFARDIQAVCSKMEGEGREIDPLEVEQLDALKRKIAKATDGLSQEVDDEDPFGP